MSREVRWSKNNNNDLRWTTKTNPPYHNVDLSFTIISGIRGNVGTIKNPKLIIRKKPVDGKVANQIILIKEFQSVWRTKYVIDALLALTRVLYKDKMPEAEQFIIETIKNYAGHPKPEFQIENVGLTYPAYW